MADKSKGAAPAAPSFPLNQGKVLIQVGHITVMSEARVWAESRKAIRALAAKYVVLFTHQDPEFGQHDDYPLWRQERLARAIYGPYLRGSCTGDIIPTDDDILNSLPSEVRAVMEEFVRLNPDYITDMPWYVAPDPEAEPDPNP